MRVSDTPGRRSSGGDGSQSKKAPSPAGPYSPALKVDGWIFLSGQGFDPASAEVVSGDIGEPNEQAFRNIEALLESAGASLSNVVSCLVHLVDLDDFPKFHEVYERQFCSVKPVRTTVRADLVAGMRVEITAVARTH